MILGKQYAIQWKDDEEIYEVRYVGSYNGFWIFQRVIGSTERMIARPSDIHVFPSTSE